MPEEKEIKNHWNAIWEDHNNGKIKFFEKIYYSIFKEQFSSKTLFRHLMKEIKKLPSKELSTIEIGCGSGLVQKKLYKTLNCNTDFFDISPEALEYSKKCLGNTYNSEKHKFIEGSLLNMPIPDNQYDIVFNAGVMEHFNLEDQIKGIAEMYRITKTGGKTIIFVPSTFGKLYIKMKKRADKKGIWKAGHEVPLTTMKHLIPPDTSYTEYSVGFISQLHYIKYIFDKRSLQYLMIPILEVLQNILFFLEDRPGYFLVGIIDKK